MSRNPTEEDLIAEIKKTLTAVADHDPSWTLILGRETLSATAVVQRLDRDPKLKKVVLRHYVGLAVEIEQRGRKKLFGEER